MTCTYFEGFGIELKSLVFEVGSFNRKMAAKTTPTEKNIHCCWQWNNILIGNFFSLTYLNYEFTFLLQT